jgi:RNA polymerase sigma factor (sigma-70 family)
MFRIARNGAIDRVRELGRVIPEEPALISLRAEAPDPTQEEELLRRLERFEFDRLVRPLRARQRQVLWLRCVRDLGDAEIAERLGITERAVTQAAYKGLQTLRARVGPLGHPFARKPAGVEQWHIVRYPATMFVRLPARVRSRWSF